MDDEDRGWPLEKEAIRAKYHALVQKDKVLKAKSTKNMAYGHILQQIPVLFSKSKSTREAYSRARSLQRVLKRAGLADTSGQGSQSLPVSSPSSVSGATSSSHRSRVKSHGVLSQEDVLAPPINVSTLSTSMVKLQKNGKQTKFLAKQFKLISNNANTTPRRNIKILAKQTFESTNVTSVAEEMERDQLQERIRVHDSDQSDPSNLAASSLTLDSLSRSPSPRKTISSYMGQAHANSPCSVVSDLSVPETVMSSVENESTDRKLTCFSITRERWTSREIFGSFDFGGELDIAASVAEASHPDSSGYHDHDRVNYCLDESLNSPSSGMRSPRQSLATSSQGGDDHHYYRDRREHCGVNTRRMKVTSPSSLFRDGPCIYNSDKPQTSPKFPRKLSRKLSTSFNQRRKQGTVQPHPESLSTRSASKDERSSSKANLTLQIAGLASGYRVASNAAGYGNGAVHEAAVTAFQDEIAQLMLDRSESNEIGDIEEFLDGYMRLQSPSYLEIVEEFFRTVSYDCYKRPLEVKKVPKVPRVPKVIRH